MHNQQTDQIAVNTSVRLEPNASGLLTVWLDSPQRSVNVIDRAMLEGLEAAVGHAAANSDRYQLVLFRSRKPECFIVGADVPTISALASSTEAEQIVLRGQTLMSDIAALPMPTLAAVHGPCLGGGLELALACQFVVASRSPKTTLALPEIKLGLIPGWGGTQRLPLKVGLEQALTMIMTGKAVDAEKGLRAGVVDLLVDVTGWEPALANWEQLLSACRTKPTRRKSFRDWLLNRTRLGRQLVLRGAERKISARRKHYPALAEALASVSAACSSGGRAFHVEREAFVRLLFGETAQCLIGLFLAQDRAKKIDSWVQTKPLADPAEGIHRVAVIGAGAMGAGIGALAATKGYQVVFKEIHAQAAKAGRQRVDDILQKQVAMHRLTETEMQTAANHMEFTHAWRDVADCDLAIEAIVEIESEKRKVFAMLDRTLRPDAIFASNTSSLCVTRMPTAGRRSTTAGLHFFNPVQRMDLVEIVRTEAASDRTVAALLAFVKSLGKTPIVTSDKPGFLVNRVLFPYLGEAVRMVATGFDAEQIDRQMRDFGMPMGPLQLLDQVGVDIAYHVAQSLVSIQADEELPTKLLARMVEKGWLGKKSGCGFYRYEESGKTLANEQLPREAVAPPVGRDFERDSLTAVQRRLVYPMLNEAVHCLDELVVTEPWMVDLAMVLGTGFAPMHGGPLRLIDKLGPATVLHNMQSLAETFGKRFAPADGLIRAVRRKETFCSRTAASLNWENQHEPRYTPQV